MWGYEDLEMWGFGDVGICGFEDEWVLQNIKTER